MRTKSPQWVPVSCHGNWVRNMKIGEVDMIDIDNSWLRVQNGQGLGLSVGEDSGIRRRPCWYLLLFYIHKNCFARIKRFTCTFRKRPARIHHGKRTTWARVTRGGYHASHRLSPCPAKVCVSQEPHLQPWNESQICELFNLFFFFFLAAIHTVSSSYDIGQYSTNSFSTPLLHEDKMSCLRYSINNTFMHSMPLLGRYNRYLFTNSDLFTGTGTFLSRAVSLVSSSWRFLSVRASATKLSR